MRQCYQLFYFSFDVFVPNNHNQACPSGAIDSVAVYTRWLATVIGESGLEARAGRIIVSGFSGVRFEIKFSGKHSVLFNLWPILSGSCTVNVTGLPSCHIANAGDNPLPLSSLRSSPLPSPPSSSPLPPAPLPPLHSSTLPLLLNRRGCGAIWAPHRQTFSWDLREAWAMDAENK